MPHKDPAARAAYEREYWRKHPERRQAKRRRQRARQGEERRKKLAAIKIERGCAHCGYNENPAALQFHHTDPAKKLAGVASLIYKSWSLVLAELDKCIVLCANCHAIHHYSPGEV